MSAKAGDDRRSDGEPPAAIAEEQHAPTGWDRLTRREHDAARLAGLGLHERLDRGVLDIPSTRWISVSVTSWGSTPGGRAVGDRSVPTWRDRFPVCFPTGVCVFMTFTESAFASDPRRVHQVGL